MYFLFKMGIFHCYVCLPEGTRQPKTCCPPRDVIAVFAVDPWGSTSSRVPCTRTLSNSAGKWYGKTQRIWETMIHWNKLMSGVGSFLCSYLNRGICFRFLSTMKHWRECKMMGDNSFQQFLTVLVSTARLFCRKAVKNAVNLCTTEESTVQVLGWWIWWSIELQPRPILTRGVGQHWFIAMSK